MRSGRTVLALGGGGARGFAHIGVLKVLEKEKVNFDVIVGSSAGSIIGAMYASCGDIICVEERMKEFFESEIFKEVVEEFITKKSEDEAETIFSSFWHFIKRGIVYSLSLSRKSLLSHDAMKKTIDYLLEDIVIERTLIPFYPVAVDLYSGRLDIIKSGPIKEAVMASCSIPGILPPFEKNGKLLIDGGWFETVPVSASYELGAKEVIAVNVEKDIGESESYDSAFTITHRASEITRANLNSFVLKEASVVININLGAMQWNDFEKYSECIKIGEAETLKRIQEIKNKLRWNKFLHIFS